MKKQLLLLTMITIVTLSACRKSTEPVRDASAYKLNYTPAKTNSELIRLRNTSKADIIRTLADFDRIASAKQTPLSVLSQDILNDLRGSLVVRENVGIVGLKYSIIQKSLSKEDFHVVMSLFGLDTKMGFWGFSDDSGIVKMTKVNCCGEGDGEGEAGEDYKEYRCSAPKNCERRTDNICLTGC